MSKQLVLCVRCRGRGDVPGAFTYCPECGGFGALFAVDAGEPGALKEAREVS